MLAAAVPDQRDNARGTLRGVVRLNARRSISKRGIGAAGAGHAQAQSAQCHLFVFRGRRGSL